MKKTLLALCALFVSIFANAQNDKADNIIGTYSAGVGKDAYKVQITKLADGTYQGAICWLAGRIYFKTREFTHKGAFSKSRSAHKPNDR